jgi:long-chain acyl-CoA synthetase
VWDSFKYRARSFSDFSAVEDDSIRLTFASLYDVAQRIALSLERSGVNSDSAVALCLPGIPVFVPAFLSLCKIHAKIVLISPKYGSSELNAIFDGVGVTSVLMLASKAEEMRKLVGAFGPPLDLLDAFPRSPLALLTRKEPGQEDAQGVHPSQRYLIKKAALFKTTSGSTGVPKSVAIEGAALLTEAENLARSLALSPGEHIVAPVPLSHSYGFDLGVLASLHSGATLRPVDAVVPRRIMAALARRETKVFLGVPSMYQLLLDNQHGPAPSLSHVRYALSCTAPLQRRTLELFNERFLIPLCQHYGSSETGAVATHVPAEVMRRPESTGVPINNVRLKIVGEEGDQLSPGGVGEVVVQSGALALGYATGTPQGRDPFDGGWYHTGDRGKLDEDGFLYLVGRMDDLINVGGLKVSPYEVVQVLESLPQVKEAAATGVRDTAAGQVVYAAVTLSSPATEDELIRACHGKLADYKIPRRIEIREELPRGPSGKIRLREEDFGVHT